jgi:hypothetical protein
MRKQSVMKKDKQPDAGEGVYKYIFAFQFQVDQSREKHARAASHMKVSLRHLALIRVVVVSFFLTLIGGAFSPAQAPTVRETRRLREIFGC